MYKRFSLLLGRVYTLSLEDLKRQEGQTTVEYAVVLALVIAMAVAAFLVLKTQVTDFMSKVGSAITNALP